MTRKLSGAAIMFVVAALLGEVLPLPAGAQGWLLPAIAGFVGAALGGYIARRGFMLLALAVHVLVWAAIFALLASGPGAQASIASLFSHNQWAMALSFPAVAAGALVGQHLAAAFALGPSQARA